MTLDEVTHILQDNTSCFIEEPEVMKAIFEVLQAAKYTLPYVAHEIWSLELRETFERLEEL